MRYLLLAAITTSLFAQKPKPPGEDWVQLYNGRDTTGWINIGQEKWTVSDKGVLQGMAVTKAYGYLMTEKKYKDFQLFLRFQCV